MTNQQKVLNYARAAKLGYTVSTPAERVPDGNTIMMGYAHTGEIIVTIGDRRWETTCWGNLPRAAEKVFADIVTELGL